MTRRHSPLQKLADHLTQLGRTEEGRHLATQLSAEGFTTHGANDLRAILSQLDPGGTPPVRLVERLATGAPDGESAAVGLLWVLRRDLLLVSTRLAQSGRLDLYEAQGDTVAAAWEVVTRRPPPTREHRRNAIWAQARQAAGIRRRCPFLALPIPEGFDAVGPDFDPFERWPGLLASAVAAGVLTPDEVILIAQTRMEGQSLTEVAGTLGRPYDAVRMERRRAEAALRTFALRYVEGSS